MRDSEHQDKVCEAAIRVMEMRKAGTRSNVRQPDMENRRDTAVDLQFYIGSAEFVLEHTLIESFHKQIDYGEQFLKLLLPLEDELSGKLPIPGHYVLSVVPGALAGIRKPDRVRAALKKWVLENAPSLPLVVPATNHIREVPTDVGFEVILRRYQGSDGKFEVVNRVQDDLEEHRRTRMRRALDEKCPKLSEARGESRNSVLVLESKDIALANFPAINTAFAEEIAHRPGDTPDEVYLVMAYCEPLVVWILMEGGKLYSEVDGAGPHYIHGC